MSLNVSAEGNSSFKSVPAGMYSATCVLICDLGKQKSGKYPPSNKVYIRWELPTENVETKDGMRPMVIGRKYTASLNEKATLRKDLESWRGRAFTPQELLSFDLKNVLGKACMLSVVENEFGGKTYSNIAAVTSVPKGYAVAAPSVEPMSYSLDGPDQGNFEKLPEFLKKQITSRIMDDERTIHDEVGEDESLPF